jgi:hypothetical protein
MNFITACFEEYDSALSELLLGAGFSADEALRFLPEASSGILDAFKHKDIEQIISAFGAKDPSQILNAVNMNTIAMKVDMSTEQVKAGLEKIAPVITQAFKHNSDGMVGAAISIAWDEKKDFIDITKNLFSQEH